MPLCSLVAACRGGCEKRDGGGMETKGKCFLAGDVSCHCAVAPSAAPFETCVTRARFFKSIWRELL